MYMTQLPFVDLFSFAIKWDWENRCFALPVQPITNQK